MQRRPMSEDPPSSPPPRSWFERITQALSGEPQSREELIEELRHARANGLLTNDTLSMLEGAIEVADLSVADVMVPRAQMISLPVDAPLKQILADVIESGHSRFPVHAGDKDEILGILLAKDLLRCFVEGADCDIRTLLRAVTFLACPVEVRLAPVHVAVPGGAVEVGVGVAEAASVGEESMVVAVLMASLLAGVMLARDSLAHP